jgi:tight adherence protein B
MIMKLAIFGLVFSSVGALVWQYSPLWAQKLSRYQSKKVKESAERLDNMFIRIPLKKLFLFHALTPLALGGVGFLVSGKMFIALILAAFGLALPSIILKRMDVQRRNKFQTQLVEGLMIFGSSLKGGLSLLQSIESLVEEMSAPLSQEFALVLRENKMGISMEESLDRLNKRMRSDDLNLIVTAISVARETGGDLSRILSQLIYTIREKNKLLGKVKTLTVQGRMQGAIMCLLPIVFTALIISLNPQFFNIMLQSEIGKFLLIYALFSQIVGILLIKKFSNLEV